MRVEVLLELALEAEDLVVNLAGVHLHEEVVQVGLHEEFAPVAEIVIEASINAG